MLSQNLTKTFKAGSLSKVAKHFLLCQNGDSCKAALTFDEFRVFIGRIVVENLAHFKEMLAADRKEAAERIEENLLVTAGHLQTLREFKDHELHLYCLERALSRQKATKRAGKETWVPLLAAGDDEWFASMEAKFRLVR